jgi:hypothetical protein
MKTIKKAASDTKGKEDKARLDTDGESLQKAIDTAQKDLDESTKTCKDTDGKLAKIVDESASKIKKLTDKIEDTKKTVETSEKEAKATIVTLPGGKEEVEKVEKKEEEEKKSEKPAKTEISTSSVTVTSGKKGKTSTGKPIAPAVPAPKPKEDKKDTKEDKAKPVPVPVQQTIIKKKALDGDVEDDEDDDGEPAEVSVTEVPGGEAQITKEVTDNTLAAHNARVDLVKTKANLKYELETIKDGIAKYKETITKTTTEVKGWAEDLKTAQSALETMKTVSITANLKNEDKVKREAEITA